MNHKVKHNLTYKTLQKIRLVMCCAMQSNTGLLPISYHFHVMLLLVNVMFPSELCQ